MKATITTARKACEAMGARQVIVLAFDAEGNFAVVSYGETRAECAAVRATCDDIADKLKSGEIHAPGGSRVR